MSLLRQSVNKAEPYPSKPRKLALGFNSYRYKSAKDSLALFDTIGGR
jgi:hypothetical protein